MVDAKGNEQEKSGFKIFYQILITILPNGQSLGRSDGSKPAFILAEPIVWPLEADIFETSRSDKIGALARAIERMGISLRIAINKLRNR